MGGPQKAALFLVVICLTLAATFTMAQQPAPTAPTSKSVASSIGAFVYPKNNQTAAQQDRDERECYQWAMKETGIDPAQPPPEPEKAEKKHGGAVKGAAGGAAAGSAIGAVANDDAGGGAATGAMVGAIRGRRQQKKAEKTAEKQQQQGYQQQKQERMNTFRRAFSSCIDGRGYSVK